MSRGYLTTALNAGPVDYLRMAYCLALSLKCTQSDVQALSVVVEPRQHVPRHYRRAFDQVLELPGRDLSTRGGWRVENYHAMYELSPYDETITLDADMLLFADVAAWWDRLEGRELVAAVALDYRGRLILANSLRSDFYAIGLPDLHNGFLYFARSDLARDVFATIGRHAATWPAAARRHFGRAVHYSSDCALLLALRDLGLESACCPDGGAVPAFVHMKACLQGWPGVARDERDWRPHARHAFSDDLRLWIDGIAIEHPFHYHVRDFVGDELLSAYEQRAGV